MKPIKRERLFFKNLKKKMRIHFRELAKKDKESGATLVEILVTIAIIVILAGGISLYVVDNLKTGNIARAKTDISTMSTAITIYYVGHNEYPPALYDISESLAGRKVPLDPWGNDYQYYAPGEDNNDYELYSYGPDRAEGGNDDISVWALNENQD